MYSWWSSYLHALKTKPLRTNTATALVITSCGDILAQRIEKNLSCATTSTSTSTSTLSSSAQDIIVVHHHQESSSSSHSHGNWIDNNLNQHQNQHHVGNNDNDGICWKRNQIVSSYWCLAAPISYYWFRWLDSRFPIPKVNAKGLLTLSKKLTLHVGVYRTTVNTLFYGWLVWFQQDNDSIGTSTATTQQHNNNNNHTTGISKHDHNSNTQNNRIQASSPTTTQATTTTITTASNTFLDQWMLKLQNDFLETQQTSVCVWGCAQTINFLFLPTHTRVLFTSFVSVFWSAYLSFIGHRCSQEEEEDGDEEEEDGREENGREE